MLQLPGARVDEEEDEVTRWAAIYLVFAFASVLLRFSFLWRPFLFLATCFTFAFIFLTFLIALLATRTVCSRATWMVHLPSFLRFLCLSVVSFRRPGAYTRIPFLGTPASQLLFGVPHNGCDW